MGAVALLIGALVPGPVFGAQLAPDALPTPPLTGRVSIPASIDPTGSLDVSEALMALIDRTPNGSTIVFPAGAVYRVDQSIKFQGRSNLTFEGNGATLRAGGAGTTEANAILWLGAYGGGNSNIAVRNLTLTGNSPTPGVFQLAREGAHGVLIDGGRDIEISNVTISGVWGDCFYLGGWTSTVWIHDAQCVSSGRSGVSITSAQDVIVERVLFDRVGYCAFNIEPNVASEGARRVRIRQNTIGTWGNSFFSAVGAPGSVVSGVSLTTNIVTHDTLLTVVDLESGRTNIALVKNVSKVAASGPVMRFAHINGLKVTANVQPLSSGPLLAIADSTRVVLD